VLIPRIKLTVTFMSSTVTVTKERDHELHHIIIRRRCGKLFLMQHRKHALTVRALHITLITLLTPTTLFRLQG